MKSDQTNNKEICLTNHEGLEPNTGMVLIAAAVRKVEGEEKQQLLVRGPTAVMSVSARAELASPLSRETPPKSHRVIPSTRTPSRPARARRRWGLCGVSGRSLWLCRVGRPFRRSRLRRDRERRAHPLAWQ